MQILESGITEEECWQEAQVTGGHFAVLVVQNGGA